MEAGNLVRPPRPRFQSDYQEPEVPQSVQDQLEARFAKLKAETRAFLTTYDARRDEPTSSREGATTPMVDIEVEPLINLDDLESEVAQTPRMQFPEEIHDPLDAAIARALATLQTSNLTTSQTLATNTASIAYPQNDDLDLLDLASDTDNQNDTSVQTTDNDNSLETPQEITVHQADITEDTGSNRNSVSGEHTGLRASGNSSVADVVERARTIFVHTVDLQDDDASALAPVEEDVGDSNTLEPIKPTETTVERSSNDNTDTVTNTAANAILPPIAADLPPIAADLPPFTESALSPDDVEEETTKPSGTAPSPVPPVHAISSIRRSISLHNTAVGDSGENVTMPTTAGGRSVVGALDDVDDLDEVSLPDTDDASDATASPKLAPDDRGATTATNATNETAVPINRKPKPVVDEDEDVDSDDFDLELDDTLRQAEERLRGMEQLHVDLEDTPLVPPPGETISPRQQQQPATVEQAAPTATTSIATTTSTNTSTVTNTNTLTHAPAAMAAASMESSISKQGTVISRLSLHKSQISDLEHESTTTLQHHSKLLQQLKRDNVASMADTWAGMEVDLELESQVDSTCSPRVIEVSTPRAQGEGAVVHTTVGGQVSADLWVDALALCKSTLAATLKKHSTSLGRAPTKPPASSEFRELLKSYVISELEVKALCFCMADATHGVVQHAKGVWVKRSHEVKVPVKFDGNAQTSTKYKYSTYTFSIDASNTLHKALGDHVAAQFKEIAPARYHTRVCLARVEDCITQVLGTLEPRLTTTDVVAVQPDTDSRADALLEMVSVVIEQLWQVTRKRSPDDSHFDKKVKMSHPPTPGAVQRSLEATVMGLLLRLGAAILRCGAERHHLDLLSQICNAPCGSAQLLGRALELPIPEADVFLNHIVAVVHNLTHLLSTAAHASLPGMDDAAPPSPSTSNALPDPNASMASNNTNGENANANANGNAGGAGAAAVSLPVPEFAVKDFQPDMLALLDYVDPVSLVGTALDLHSQLIIANASAGSQVIRFAVHLALELTRDLQLVQSDLVQRNLVWYSVQIMRQLHSTCKSVLAHHKDYVNKNNHHAIGETPAGEFHLIDYLSGGVCVVLFSLLKRRDGLWDLGSSLEFSCCSRSSMWACFHMLSRGPGAVPEDSAVGSIDHHAVPETQPRCLESPQAHHILATVTKLALAASQRDAFEQMDVAEACMLFVLRAGFVWPTRRTLGSVALQSLKSICKFRTSMVSKLLQMLDVILESDEPGGAKTRRSVVPAPAGISGQDLVQVVRHVVVELKTWFPSSYDLQRLAKWLQQPLGLGPVQAAQVLLTGLTWEKAPGEGGLQADAALVVTKALAHHTDGSKSTLFGGSEGQRLLRQFTMWVWGLLGKLRFFTDDGRRVVPLRPKDDPMVRFVTNLFKAKDSRLCDAPIAYALLLICGELGENQGDKRTGPKELVTFLLDSKRISAVLSVIPELTASLVTSPVGAEDAVATTTAVTATTSSSPKAEDPKAALASALVSLVVGSLAGQTPDRASAIQLTNRVCGILGNMLKRSRMQDTKTYFALWFHGIAQAKWRINVARCVMLNVLCKWAFAKQMRTSLSQACLLRIVRGADASKKRLFFPLTGLPQFVFRADRVRVFEAALDYPWLVFEVMWFETQLWSDDWLQAGETLKNVKWTGGMFFRKPTPKAVLSKIGLGHFGSRSPLHRWMRVTIAMPTSNASWPVFLQAATTLYLFEHPGSPQRGLARGDVGHQMWHLLIDGGPKSKKLREAMIQKLETAAAENPKPSDATIALCRALALWFSSPQPDELLRSMSRLGPQYAPDYVRLCSDATMLARRVSSNSTSVTAPTPGELPTTVSTVDLSRKQAVMVLADTWAPAMVNRDQLIEAMKPRRIDLLSDAAPKLSKHSSVAFTKSLPTIRQTSMEDLLPPPSQPMSPPSSDALKPAKVVTLEPASPPDLHVQINREPLLLELGLPVADQVPNFASQADVEEFVSSVVDHMESSCATIRGLADEAIEVNRAYVLELFPKLYVNAADCPKLRIQHPSTNQVFSVELKLASVGKLQSTTEQQMVQNRKKLMEIIRLGVWDLPLDPLVEMKLDRTVTMLLSRLRTHPTEILLCETILFRVMALLHTRTRVLPPLRRSVERWVNSMCKHVVPAKPVPGLSHIPDKLLSTMLTLPDGAVPVLAPHFHPHDHPRGFTELYIKVSDVVGQEYARVGMLEALECFQFGNWISTKPVATEVTTLLEVCSRNLSKHCRTAFQTFPDLTMTIHLWNCFEYDEKLASSLPTPQLRMLRLLEHTKGMWVRGIMFEFPSHFLQAVKWLLEASAKQMAPASLWVEVSFAFEAVSSFMTCEQTNNALSLIRKHLHTQRSQNKNIFEALRFYLLPLLTFVDSLMAPHLASSTTMATPAECENLRGLAKTIAKLAEELLCATDNDAWNWDSAEVVNMCDVCVRWLQRVMAQLCQRDTLCFRVFWESFAKRIVPFSKDAVVSCFRIANFNKAGKWHTPEAMLDPETISQMRLVVEKQPLALHFVLDLFMSLHLPETMPPNLCAPVISLSISLFRVISSQMQSNTQQIAAEKTPILALLKRVTRPDWRYANTNSINPLLFEMSATFTGFFHGCNFTSTRVFVEELTEPVPTKCFVSPGCGFLCCVLLLRTACLRSPSAFESYFEYLHNCITMHASLSNPRIGILKTLVGWLVHDFLFVMSWICATVPALNIFPTNLVDSSVLDPRTRARTMSTGSAGGYPERAHFAIPDIVPVGDLFIKMDPARVREVVVSLWGTLNSLFNHRVLDSAEIALAENVSRILSTCPGVMCALGLASACEAVSDVEVMSWVCELYCEGLLCSPPPGDCGFVDSGMKAWSELQARVRFPETDEPKFLAAAHNRQSLFVLCLFIVKKQILGEAWSTGPVDRPHRSLETHKARVRIIHGAKIFVDWILQLPLPQPPVAQKLLEKLAMSWSVATLLVVRAVVLAGMLEQSGELPMVLGRHMLSMAQHGEKGGFFQKLSHNKSVFGVDICLLLRLFGTFLLFLTPKSTAKERSSWVEKLNELKKFKAYQPWLPLLDWMLAVLPRVSVDDSESWNLAKVMVSKTLGCMFPNAMCCVPLLQESEIEAITRAQAPVGVLPQLGGK